MSRPEQATLNSGEPVAAVGASPPVYVRARATRRGAWLRRQHPSIQVLIRLASMRMSGAGLAVVILMGLFAVFAPVIAPYPPNLQHPGSELRPPSSEFWLGSDDLGRDLFTRILFGARVSFVVGILATALGAAVGITTGLLSGYLGGWIDSVIMRFYDALLAFPGIIIGIAVISILGPSTINVAYALAIGGMPFFARLMRSSVLSERERDYVYAAKSVGAGDGRIMFRHVLPNTLAPLLVQLSLAMGFAVLAEAGLSFLGLGTQPPDPSWGTMLNDSRAYLREAPWYGLWPGVALTILLVALNYVSDGLRDALDPRGVNRR